MMRRSEKDQKWMDRILYQEMVVLLHILCFVTYHIAFQELCFSHVGVAAVISQPLNIPVIIQSLGQDMYRVGMIPDGLF